jgi:hypothetical protein
MSSNLSKLTNFVILREALHASDERATTLFMQLPRGLADRMQAIQEGSLALSEQSKALAIRQVTLEILSAQTSDDKKIIHDVFYKYFRMSEPVDYEWVEQHIGDDDKAPQLLESLEIAEARKIADAWAGEDIERRQSVEAIFEFIRNKEQDDLDLSCQGLQTLPDIFMIHELRSRLKTLSISQNQITTLPDSLSHLLSLQNLYICRNEIEMIPEWIGDLKDLEVLFACENELHSLPASIGNLGQLRELHLDGNLIQTIPASIGNLGNLRLFLLNDNQLRELPRYYFRSATRLWCLS